MAEYIARKEIFSVWRSMSAPASLESLADAIHKTPGIDIVRCKDCRWFNEPGCAIYIVDDSDKPKADDFCSFGERRTDG